MGRPKSEDRLVYDSKFQKTQDGKWQCLLCQQVLPGMKASNFLSHAKDHIENACPIPAKRIATTCHALTLETELETFLQTIDDQTCAFDFFKSHINQKSFPRLSEVARFVLGILPSPAVCEQNFSRAAILTENRRNKLSMLSVKNRLILS